MLDSVESKPSFVLNNTLASKYYSLTALPKDLSDSKLLTTYTNSFRHHFTASLLSRSNSSSNSGYYNSLNNLVNVNFIRKERLYTKLKYSRSPAYDIVSGGAAALLAGLIGFLVSEKFGMELVDSGDFYYLFMYMVFLAFSVRPLLEVMDYRHSLLSLFSLRRVIEFYVNITLNILRIFKK